MQESEFLYQIIALALAKKVGIYIEPYLTEELEAGRMSTVEYSEAVHTILVNAYAKKLVPNPPTQEELKELTKGICYRTLNQIRKILDNETLDDSECCMKIEEIIGTLESIGTDGGSRHDW